jgi:hypothetical protein
VICSRFVRDLFVICSQFVRNLFVICLFSIFFVVYSRIVRDLFANCLQIICSPLFTNKTNKTRISRSLFAFLKNHECLFAFFFGLFVDTLLYRAIHVYLLYHCVHTAAVPVVHIIR